MLKRSWLGRRLLDERDALGFSKQSQHVVEAIADADFASCKESRRSTSAGQVYINSSLVPGFSRTQRSVTLSSGESELVALTQVLSEALLIADAWRFLTPDDQTLIEARSDSSACRGIASRRGVGRVRHLDASCLWVQEVVATKQVKLLPIGALVNVADAGTKALTSQRLKMLCCLMGFVQEDNCPYGQQELDECRAKQKVLIIMMNHPCV